MKEFVCRPGMINFVKIHAVHIAWLVRHRILLIEKRRTLRRSGGEHRRKAAAGSIKESDLIERDRSRHAFKRNIPRMHRSALCAPGEHGRVFLHIFGRGAVVAGEYRCALGNVAIRPDLGNVVFRTKIDAHRRAVPCRPNARRERERAEIQQREHCINKRQYPHQTLIAAI